MARRRPPEPPDEDSTTALDLGRNIASQARKPRPSDDDDDDERAQPQRPSRPVASDRNQPAPRSVVLHMSDVPGDDEATDYLTPRPNIPAPAPTRPSARKMDDDATEFLAERPTGQSRSLRSLTSQTAGDREHQGLKSGRRAVPIEGAPAARASDPPRAPSPRGAAHSPRPITENEDEDVTEPPVRVSGASARGRDEASSEPSDEPSDEAPRSLPRVTRFFVAAPVLKAGKDPAAFDAGAVTEPGPPDQRAAPPQTSHRPLPARADLSASPPRPATNVGMANPFKRETTLTRPAATREALDTAAETSEAESMDGLLVIEVPENARVFVNGEERGAGPQLRITGLDRYARHAIKIQAPGYLRWSGTVSLDGRNAAKVRPQLKKK